MGHCCKCCRSPLVTSSRDCINHRLHLCPSAGTKAGLLRYNITQKNRATAGKLHEKMGRSPCCAMEGLNRGAWTPIEDKILKQYIKVHGQGSWRNLPKRAGLKRCGRSCRLRWLNYLRPDIKRGNISPDEEELIIRLHKLLGNRWSLIAGRLPGRTDNEIKNYWNTILSKKVKQMELDKTGLASSSWDNNNNVIRTKATKCSSRVNFHPHSQPYHIDVATGPPNDVGGGELSVPKSNENLGDMLEVNEDLDMEFLNLNFSELCRFMDEDINDGLLPSSSSSISDELALMEAWLVE